MQFLIVAVFAIVTPIFARPQAPQPLATSPQQYHSQSGSEVTPISIISQTEVVGPDGSFNYSYDTSNGVHVEQGGYIKQAAQAKSVDPNDPEGSSGDIQVIQGAYSYTAPDGQQISLRYVADENGFQPEGEHLPKAPEGLARALEQQGGQQPQHQQYQQQQQQQQPQQYQQQQYQHQQAANPSPVTQA